MKKVVLQFINNYGMTSFGMIVFVSIVMCGAFFFGSYVYAQNWNNPVNIPPTLNAGQPISTDDLEGYVRKAPLYMQAIEGPLDVGLEGSLRAYFGGDTKNISIRAQDTDTSAVINNPDVFPSANIGIHGYGSLYGVYGRSAIGSVPGGVAAGIVGRSDVNSSDDPAGFFFGPVDVRDSAYSGADASIESEGILYADGGISCKDANCTIDTAGDTYWARGEHDASGTGVYSEAAQTSIQAVVDAPSYLDNGAVYGYALSGYGFSSYGAPGLSSWVTGSNYGQSYVALVGENTNPGANPGAAGVRGVSHGGVTYAGVSIYDNAAGVRACMKDFDGTILNEKGIFGSGGLYAGYFDYSSAGCPSDWWDCSWRNRVTITLDNQGNGVLTDFPVLVRLDSSNWKGALAHSSGYDLRVIDDDGTTELSYEVEEFDQTGETILWVKVPQIEDSENDFVTVYYNNDAISVAYNSNPAAVWSNGYEAVWHLNEVVSDGVAGLLNSVENSHHLTPNNLEDGDGGTTDVNGLIAGGVQLSSLSGGSRDDYLETPWSPDLNTAQFTVSVLYMRDNCASGWVISSNADSPSQGYELDNRGCTVSGQSFQLLTGSTGQTIWGPQVNNLKWVNVAAEYTGTDSRLFSDGALVDSRTIPYIQNNGTGSLPSFVVGSRSLIAYDNFFAGVVDEIRVSSVARSDQWIAAQNQSLTNTYQTYTAESLDSGGTLYVTGTGSAPGGGLDPDFDNGSPPANGAIDYPPHTRIAAMGQDATSLYLAGKSSNQVFFVKKDKITGVNDGSFGVSGQYFGNYPSLASQYTAMATDDTYMYLVGSQGSYRDSDLITVDSTGDVGYFASAAVGPDDLAVIVYYDLTNQALKLLKCGVPDCSSGNTITTVVSGLVLPAGTKEDILDVAVGSNNNPVIVYPDGFVKYVRCFNPTCSSSSAPGNQITSGGTASHARIVLDSNRWPIVIYGRDSDNSLRVARCQNDDCTAVTANALVTTGNPQSHGWFQVVLPSDQRPIVSYYDQSNGNLYVIRCVDTDCSPGATPVLIDDQAYEVGLHNAITMTSSGLPFIAYMSDPNTVANQELKIVKCGNINCSSGNQFHNFGAGLGSKNEVTIDQDGRPLITTVDQYTSDTYTFYCYSDSCQSGNIKTRIRNGLGFTRPDVSQVYLAGADLPLIAFYDSTAPGDLIVYPCATRDCSVEGWIIEKRRLDTGALEPTFGNGGVMNGDTRDSAAGGEAKDIVIDGTYMYISGETGDTLGRIEKRKLSDGILCRFDQFCEGSNFNNWGFKIISDYSNPGSAIAIDTVNHRLYVGSGERFGNDGNWYISKLNATTGANCSGGSSCGTDPVFGSFGAVGTAHGYYISDIEVADNNLFVAGHDRISSVNYWTIEKRRLDTGEICNTANTCNNGPFDTNGYVQLGDPSSAADMYVIDNYIYTTGRGGSSPEDWRIDKRSVYDGALDPDFVGSVPGVVTSAGGRRSYAIVVDDEALYIGGDNDSINWRLEKRIRKKEATLFTIGNTTITVKIIKGLMCKVGFSQYCP